MKTNFKKISILTSVITLAVLGITGIVSTSKSDVDVNYSTLSARYDGIEEYSKESFPEVVNFDATTRNAIATTKENDGEHLYVWGSTGDSLAGKENELIAKELIEPHQILFDDWSPSWEFTDISIGSRMAMVLIEDSTGAQHLYGWGNNDQIAEDNSSEHFSLLYGYPPEKIYSPVELSLEPFGGQEIKDIEVGVEVSYVITNDGTTDHIYSWGSNVNGATGNGLETGSTDMPTEITLPNMTNFEVNSIDGYNEPYSVNTHPWRTKTILSTTDLDTNTSSVYSWGDETNGSFGFEGDPNNGTERKQYTPGIVKQNLPGVVETVIFGNMNTAALYVDPDGVNTIWQWSLSNGTTNNGTTSPDTNVLEPTQTYTTEGTSYNKIENLAMGYSQTAFIASNTQTGQKDIIQWGQNTGNLLQVDDKIGQDLTANVLDTSFTDGNVKNLFSMDDYMFALVDEEDAPGQLYSWGKIWNYTPILGQEPVYEDINGEQCIKPTKIQFNFFTPEEDASFPWWILFVILTAIGIIIILLMLWEIHLDHGEKHEHHWLHIGRHHE